MARGRKGRLGTGALLPPKLPAGAGVQRSQKAPPVLVRLNDNFIAVKNRRCPAAVIADDGFKLLLPKFFAVHTER